MRFVLALLLALPVFPSSVFALNILGVSVTRGTNDTNERFDRINAMMFLEPGEDVYVEYFAFRSYRANEPAAWVPIQFAAADGSTSYRLTTPGYLKNEDPIQKKSMQLYVDYPLKGFGGPERGWNTITYGIRVFHPGDPAPEKAPSYYSFYFPVSDSPEQKEAEQARTGLLLMSPFPVLSVRPPELVSTTLESPEGAGVENKKWVVDLPAIDVKWEDVKKAAAETRPVTDQRVLGYFQPTKVIAKDVEAPRTENDSLYARVHFFTNRPISGYYKKEQPWVRAFDLHPGRKGGQRAEEAHMGWTDVYIPVGNRKKGELGARDPKTEKITGDRFALTDRRFFYKHNAEVDLFKEIWTKPVLVFLHGFNVDLEEAILRAAQMKVDMDWQHPIVVLDWPSYALVQSYKPDRDLVEGDEGNNKSIAAFLIALTNNSVNKNAGPAGQRFLICHSMGNEVFNQVTTYMEKLKLLSKDMFTHIIFAAPDVYIGDFKRMVNRLRISEATPAMTLYYSRKDIAVRISRLRNFVDTLLDLAFVFHPTRIVEFVKGRAGITPYDYVGVDIINADLVNSAWADIFSDFHHGYFAGSDKVEKDIETIIKYGTSAKFRTGTLLPKQQPFGDSYHYVIAP